MILYDVGPCLVVNKPAGIATQAPPGIDSMERQVRDFYRHREGKSGNIYLGVPHRLDRPASGALVFARHQRAARRISAQFDRREVRKIYWAIVEGRVAPPAGTWRDFLLKSPDRAHVQVVTGDQAGCREAILQYRVLQAQDDVTLIEVTLETGRTHQIRVQAASRGYPIWGDLQYGARRLFGCVPEDERQRAIALHARRLVFRHPMLDETVDVTAPLSPNWPGAWNHD